MVVRQCAPGSSLKSYLAHLVRIWIFVSHTLGWLFIHFKRISAPNCIECGCISVFPLGSSGERVVAHAVAVISINALVETDLSVSHTRLILVSWLMISELMLRASHILVVRILLLVWRWFVPQPDLKLFEKAHSLALSCRQVLVYLQCALINKFDETFARRMCRFGWWGRVIFIPEIITCFAIQWIQHLLAHLFLIFIKLSCAFESLIVIVFFLRFR